MPELRLRMDKATDKKVRMYMVMNDFHSKENAILDILRKLSIK